MSLSSFGKLASCAVDGAIYAQPLWVANVTVGGARHNVVFVATEHDSLFAFDADSTACTQLWRVSLIDPAHGASAGETPLPSVTGDALVGANYGDIQPEIGVTGTPVIDPATGILYVVSKSVDATQTLFYQRLHAIDITTGREETGSPIAIAATVSGTGSGGTTGLSVRSRKISARVSRSRTAPCTWDGRRTRTARHGTAGSWLINTTERRSRRPRCSTPRRTRRTAVCGWPVRRPRSIPPAMCTYHGQWQFRRQQPHSAQQRLRRFAVAIDRIARGQPVLHALR